MQSAITQPQDATYQQLGEGGGERKPPRCNVSPQCSSFFVLSSSHILNSVTL